MSRLAVIAAIALTSTISSAKPSSRAAEIAAIKQQVTRPLTAAGIRGEKLQLLVDHAGYRFYGLGGGALTAPAQLAKAKVIFELTSNEEAWMVRRYQFAGNKLAGSSAETYLARPDATAFR